MYIFLTSYLYVQTITNMAVIRFSFLFFRVQWSRLPSLWWQGLSSAEEASMFQCVGVMDSTVWFSVSLLSILWLLSLFMMMFNMWCHCLLWLLEMDLDYMACVCLGPWSNKLLDNIHQLLYLKTCKRFVKFCLFVFFFTGFYVDW